MAKFDARIGDRFEAVRGTSLMNKDERIFEFEVTRFNGSSIYAKIVSDRESDFEYRFDRRTLETRRDAVFGKFKVIDRISE